MPIEIVVAAEGGSGMTRISHASARIAGGQVRWDGWMRIGVVRPFHIALRLSDIDLQAITRQDANATHPASGRVEGQITLDGADPTRLDHAHGRVDLTLTDASLVSIPVFREIDKFLGSSRGGLFSSGNVHGMISNRHLNLESATLRGRLVQLHATGTVGLDGRLGLEVLVNTPQIISLTGQALIAIIPGLREALGRRDLASTQVSGYLSSRLLKLRVSGTLNNPSVTLDPSINVGDSAVGFFSGVLELPIDRSR